MLCEAWRAWRHQEPAEDDRGQELARQPRRPLPAPRPPPAPPTQPFVRLPHTHTRRTPVVGSMSSVKHT